MKPKVVRVGDVVLIPVVEGFASAKVLFVSKRFKNVILLGVFARSIVETQASTLPSQYCELLYTSREPIAKGRWIVTGEADLSETDRALSKRIVAGNVWLDDEMLGVATDRELHELPKMLVVGAALVERRAQALVSRG